MSPSSLELSILPRLRNFHLQAQGMSNLDSLAIHLIREGQWSEAISLYREELGVSVAQAEAKVLLHGLLRTFGG